MAGRNCKACVICGRSFPCPPSDKTITCSPECRSERARRKALELNAGARLHTEAARRKRDAAAAQSERVHRHMIEASKAALKLPEGQRGPQNRSAKVWRLVSPAGDVIEVVSLSDWARANYAIFEPCSDDIEASAHRIRAGFMAVSRTLAGTLSPGQRGARTYKGWTLDGCSKLK